MEMEMAMEIRRPAPGWAMEVGGVRGVWHELRVSCGRDIGDIKTKET